MYKKVYDPTHPRHDLLGMVANYILVAEKKLGRPLAKGEVVHHKDFDKSNDDPDNLWILTNEEHRKIPELQARFLVEKGLYEEFEKWYKLNATRVDKIKELRYKINAIENKQARLQRKLDNAPTSS